MFREFLGFMFSYLNKKNRIYIYFFIPLTIISSIFEVVSIGILVPYCTYLIDPNSILNEKSLLSEIFIFFSQRLNISTLTAITITFLSVTIISSITRTHLIWFKNKTNYIISERVSQMIFRNILHSDYESFHKNTPSKYISILSSKTDTFSLKFVLPILTLFSNLIYVLIIFLALLFLNWKITSSFLLFGAFYVSVLFLFRKKLLKYSFNISNNLTSIIGIVKSYINGFVETKIYSLEIEALKSFSKKSNSYRKALYKNQALSETPRYVFEAILIISGIMLMNYLFSTYGGDYLLTLLPVLITLAFATQKILPSLQQIYGSWSSIIGSKDIVNEVLELLDNNQPKISASKPNKINNDLKLVLKNYTLVYGEKTHKPITTTIVKNEKVAIIGETGSGKTSFFRAILGLINNFQGEVKWLTNNHELKFNDVISNSGYVGQFPVFLEKNIYQNITLDFNDVTSTENENRVLFILKNLDLQHIFRKRKDLHRILIKDGIQTFSGGELQRLALARIIFLNKPLNFIDEGTSALDEKTEKKVINFLFSELKDSMVFFITHKTRIIKHTNRLINLNE